LRIDIAVAIERRRQQTRLGGGSCCNEPVAFAVERPPTSSVSAGSFSRSSTRRPPKMP